MRALWENMKSRDSWGRRRQLTDYVVDSVVVALKGAMSSEWRCVAQVRHLYTQILPDFYCPLVSHIAPSQGVKEVSRYPLNHSLSDHYMADWHPLSLTKSLAVMFHMFTKWSLRVPPHPSTRGVGLSEHVDFLRARLRGMIERPEIDRGTDHGHFDTPPPWAEHPG